MLRSCRYVVSNCVFDHKLEELLLPFGHTSNMLAEGKNQLLERCIYYTSTVYMCICTCTNKYKNNKRLSEKVKGNTEKEKMINEI